MKLTYIYNEGPDPVFLAEYQGQKCKVMFIRSEVDYGWTWLDYLPEYTEEDSGRASLTQDQEEEIMEMLNDVDWRAIKEAA